MERSLFNSLKTSFFSLLVSTGTLNLLTKILSKFFRVIAVTGQGSDICLRNGFLPLPVHFYSPIPDIKDLEERRIWDVRSELPGIDFRPEQQLELLTELGTRFGGECRWPLNLLADPSEFYLQNPSFSYGCAASTHCMIRNVKPRAVVEIGSGMSSRVITKALAKNSSEDGRGSDYLIVDPYPGEAIKEGLVRVSELVAKRVELIDFAFWKRLKANDILFIDSGHCVKIGGDVNYLFLEILPRLAPGVIIHIHDINLPYEYPRVYAMSETFRQFWTEQYLLQAFLCFNNEFEILLAMNYLMIDCAGVFRKAFPFYDPEIHPLVSSSFWIRRRVADKGEE